MPQSSRADVIARVCAALSSNERDAAVEVARTQYPWTSTPFSKRAYSQIGALRIFLRDGFIDRYFGSRLVFPGVLLILARVLPGSFPAHPTWKVSESHGVYWELWPAVDHLIPVSRGGTNDSANLYSTSTLHNSAKGHWLLDEIGWNLYPAGDLSQWDGLLSWFLKYIETAPELLHHSQIKSWHKAATKATGA